MLGIKQGAGLHAFDINKLIAQWYWWRRSLLSCGEMEKQLLSDGLGPLV